MQQINSFQHGYALLVGVGQCKYSDWSLPASVQDVLALKAVLTDPGLCAYPADEGHIRLLHDSSASRENILAGLAWLAECARRDPNATAVIYYSGHGWLSPSDGRYYLIPHNVQPFNVPNSALTADQFSAAVRAVQPRRLLVILDCCHAEGMATAKDMLPAGLSFTAVPKSLVEPLSQGRGRAVFSSSTGEQLSWLHPKKGLSLYTYHLIEALQGAGSRPGDHEVTLSHLMAHLSAAVPHSARELCHREQTPFFDMATEDFPIALLRGGKGISGSGWKFEDTLETGAERSRYLEALVRQCQVLRLAAMGADEGADADVTLDQVYIELDTTTPLHPSEAISQAAGEDERFLTALEAARQSTRMALLGDPGAGKSTFAHKLAGWQAGAMLGRCAPPPGFTPDLLPIFITLRDLVAGLRKIEDYNNLSAAQRDQKLRDCVHERIKNDLKDWQVAGSYELLLRHLQTGTCLLVLDGLDEVPAQIRGRVRQAATALISYYKLQRIIVTCRVRSYTGAAVLPHFTVYTLQPFNPEKIRRFITAWYHTQQELGRMTRRQAAEKSANLAKAAFGPGLRELASNPLLLTTMAIIHQREISLPNERVRLYYQAVEVLLRRWQREKGAESEDAISERLTALLSDGHRLLEVVERLAYEAHAKNAGRDQPEDLDRMAALDILEKHPYVNDVDLANKLLDYIDQRAGLLVGRGGDEARPQYYSFPHRTFQEYLAGCHLAGRRNLSVELFRLAAQNDYWDNVVRMCIEETGHNRRSPNALLDTAFYLSSNLLPDSPQRERSIMWAGYMLAQVGSELVEEIKDVPIDWAAFLYQLRGKLAQVLSGQLNPVERAAAGDVLAALGDPRPEITTLAGMQFCLVPGGPFMDGDRKPYKQVDLPAFWIGRFPVSNAQYAEFVKDGGYSDARWWGDAIEAHCWTPAGIQGEEDAHPRTAPVLRTANHSSPEVFELSNRPVVGVCWYEAYAFTRWFDDYLHASGCLPTGWHLGLPGSQQWVKAGRGGLEVPIQPRIVSVCDLHSALGGLAHPQLEPNSIPERTYPWGNTFDPSHANTAISYLQFTTALGCYPAGASPVGAQEMAGNVWEWSYARFEQVHPDYRVVLGGSWKSPPLYARCYYRYEYNPKTSYIDRGFRCVLYQESERVPA